MKRVQTVLLWLSGIVVALSLFFNAAYNFQDISVIGSIGWHIARLFSYDVGLWLLLFPRVAFVLWRLILPPLLLACGIDLWHHRFFWVRWYLALIVPAMIPLSIFMLSREF